MIMIIIIVHTIMSQLRPFNDNISERAKDEAIYIPLKVNSLRNILPLIDGLWNLKLPHALDAQRYYVAI